MSDSTDEREQPDISIQPQQPADAWGQDISDTRKVELDALFARQHQWVEQLAESRGDSVFKEVRLTGADVFWLAIRALVGLDASTETLAYAAQDLDLRRQVNLNGTDLTALHLEGSNLFSSHLENAYLSESNLAGAKLHFSYLAGADLSVSDLKGADLSSSDLAGANLSFSHLEGADLSGSDLKGAKLSESNLEGADLSFSHLEGADLVGSHLEGANLRQSWLDSRTILNDADIDDRTQLGDIQWSGVGAVNLTQIDWEHVRRLGDEQGDGVTSASWRHAAAVRAYRQLAAQLRAQGLSEVADRFAHRAQIRQRYAYRQQIIEDWRRPWRLPGDLARYLGSAALAVLAGYGYQPGRTIILYLVFIMLFAAIYFTYGTGCPVGGVPDMTHILAQQIPNGYACSAHPMTWNEAVVVSLTAFHGRGFLANDIKPSDPQATIAAVEAVLGLIIEVSFIATFTQRFFGSK